jgi:hypothetical protein
MGMGQLGVGLLSKKPKRPEYEIQNEYTKNAYDAEQMAKEGLPQAQYENAMSNIDRNQAGALRTASNLGGGSALKSLNNILQSSNDATLHLDVQDAAARRNNMLLAMQQRGILAGQKQNKWDYDKRQVYDQKYQNRQRLIGAGIQNIVGGAQTAAGLSNPALGGVSAATYDPSSISNMPSMESIGSSEIQNNYSMPTPQIKGILG